MTFREAYKSAQQVVEQRRQECPEDFDPQALYVTAIMIALAVISAAVGSYSAVSASNAQKDAANFNSKVAQNNATAATQQAQYHADMVRNRNRAILGQQRAALSKSGVSISGGTSEDLLFDSAVQGEMDVAATLYTGSISAGAQESESRLQRMRASNAETAGYIGVGTSILSGATTAVEAYTNPNFRS